MVKGGHERRNAATASKSHMNISVRSLTPLAPLTSLVFQRTFADFRPAGDSFSACCRAFGLWSDFIGCHGAAESAGPLQSQQQSAVFKRAAAASQQSRSSGRQSPSRSDPGPGSDKSLTRHRSSCLTELPTRAVSMVTTGVSRLKDYVPAAALNGSKAVNEGSWRCRAEIWRTCWFQLPRWKEGRKEWRKEGRKRGSLVAKVVAVSKFLSF